MPSKHETFSERQARIAGTDYSKYNAIEKPAKKTKLRAASGRTLTVYHFSKFNDLTQTDPTKMRAGVHPFWGQESPKTFFFVKGSERVPGSQFSNRTAYTAQLDLGQLYDATQADPLGFTTKVNRVEADNAVLSAGYAGVIIPIKGGQKVVIVFEPVNVSPIGKTDGSGKFV